MEVVTYVVDRPLVLLTLEVEVAGQGFMQWSPVYVDTTLVVYW